MYFSSLSCFFKLQTRRTLNHSFATSLGAATIPTPRIGLQDVFNKWRSGRKVLFNKPSFLSLNLAAGMLAVVLFFSNRGRVLRGCAVFQVGEFVTVGDGDVPTEMDRMHRHEFCA